MNLPLKVVASLVVAMLLAGCISASPASRFYVLTPTETTSLVTGNSDWVIGVGPIRLPGYLERDQIVARSASNSLQLVEFDRWGGGLDRNISDVVAENLSRLLATDGAVSYPWGSSLRVDFQVALDIRRLERTENGPVQLIAQWQLFQGDSEQLLEIRRAELTEAVTGEDFNAQAAAQSRALGRLSRMIADSILATKNR